MVRKVSQVLRVRMVPQVSSACQESQVSVERQERLVVKAGMVVQVTRVLQASLDCVDLGENAEKTDLLVRLVPMDALVRREARERMGIQEEKDLEDHVVYQDVVAQQVLLENSAIPELRANVVHQAKKVTVDLSVLQARLDQTALQDHRVHPDPRVQTEITAHQDQEENMVHVVLLGKSDHQDLAANAVFQAHVAKEDPVERKDIAVGRDHRVLLGLLDLRDLLDIPVRVVDMVVVVTSLTITAWMKATLQKITLQ